MTNIIPHDTLVVVADGTGAKFFRNSGSAGQLALKADGQFNPTDLLNDGPAGHRPPESSKQETDEATFAKQLSKELNWRALNGEFKGFILVADPETLGQMRPLFHKELKARLILEVVKTLTKASIKEIEKALN